jgi:ABC-2 type transport system ATP-binding protein
MSLAGARLLGSLAVSVSVAAAALAFVAVDPPLTRLDALPSVLASVGAACVLFMLLSRQVRLWRRPPRQRVPPLALKAAYVTITSAGEEVFWRWLVLGGLAPVVGLVPAFLGSTVGFAIAHGIRRMDVVAVHLATGAAFGTVYVVTGHIEAAILTHAVYNWLVLVAIESGAAARRLPAKAGPWKRDMSSTAILLSRGQQLRSARSGRGAALKGGERAVQGAGGRAARPERDGAALTSAMRLPASVVADTPAVLERVRKSYGNVEALKGFSLTVRVGEVVALLGPNGAGKTTALLILLGLRSPDEGRARIFGRNPREVKARRLLGATPQETGFPPTLRVTEVIDLVRAHYPHPLDTADVLTRFGLAEVARRQIGGLSGGQKRRLAVGLAFVGNPRAVFLDEPTTGLDVEARRRVWDAIRGYAENGGTVLLTTHYLEEADALASRVAVIARGAMLAEGSPAEVKARTGLKRIRVKVDGELPKLSGVERATRAGRVHTLYAADAGAVVELLVASGVALQDLEVSPVTLEEAFLSLTEHTQ